MNRTTLLIYGFVTGAALAVAADRPVIPETLTLKDAMRIAFEQSTALRTAEARLSQSEARADQARAALLPQLSLSAYQSEQTTNLRAMGIEIPFLPKRVGPFPSMDLRIGATQDILNFGTWSRRRAARERVVTAQEQAKNSREMVALGIANAYFNSLRAQNTVNTLTEQVKLARNLETITRDRFQLGVASRLELNRSEQQVNNLQQNLEEATQALTASKLQLAYLMHARMSSAYSLEPVDLAATLPAVQDQAIQQAHEGRPDYRAVQSQVRAAELQVKAVRATRLPILQFQGDFGQSGRTPNDNLSTWRVRGGVSMPLFTGGRIEAEAAEARAQLEEAKAQLDDVEALVEADVLTALSAVTSAREQVKVSEQNLRLSRQELELASDRFSQGVADNTEVVNAQDRVTRAEDARIRALHNLNIAQANLLRATGAAERTFRQ